ncbi:hypothetical protein NP233_g12360 [Leucocoprinus birnbaumii]|uniref:Uncharacterized protein n=1 Tax=Leucocoprinus birnbaumii TaxID=56174 RepID=A0AAD5YQ26_9AGAR|nr:hypothetical protein NP233_g12360 [Leucocoprinus birnbaumii]
MQLPYGLGPSYKGLYVNTTNNSFEVAVCVLLSGSNSIRLSRFSRSDSLIPDPTPQPPSANQSSLRLTVPLCLPRTKVQKEVPLYNVLSGFSFMGGVWTSVNGTFSTIFGTTLLLIIFGWQPLSVYGIVHKRSRPVLKVRQAELTEEEQGHILRVIKERFIDAGDKAAAP